MTDNLMMLAAVVGFFSPPLIAMVQQPEWSKRARSLVTFSYSAVVGVLTVWLSGNIWTVPEVVTTILIILVTTISIYKGLWKPSGTTEAIENGLTKPRMEIETEEEVDGVV